MRTSSRATSMSLLFSSARLTASLSDSVSALPLVTPRRVMFGSGGSGLGCTVGKTGSRGSSTTGVSVDGDGDGDAKDTAGTVVVTPGTVGGPGGVCGAVCWVAGGAAGLCVSVPGGAAAFGVGLAAGTCAQLTAAVAA